MCTAYKHQQCVVLLWSTTSPQVCCVVIWLKTSSFKEDARWKHKTTNIITTNHLTYSDPGASRASDVSGPPNPACMKAQIMTCLSDSPRDLSYTSTYCSLIHSCKASTRTPGLFILVQPHNLWIILQRFNQFKVKVKWCWWWCS